MAQLLLRTAGIMALAWLAMLFSGYGIVIASTQNIAGLGVECRYLTAHQVVSEQFIHSESDFIGVSACPVLHKVEKMVG